MTSVTLSALPAARSYVRTGALLMGGGALWIIYYGLQLGMGLSVGAAEMKGRFGLMDGSCFSGAIVLLCLGLGSLALSQRPRALKLSSLSLSFACLAATCMMVGWVRAALTGQPPQIWGGIGVIGSCLCATFGALAARKSGELPVRLAISLLLVGLLTFPLIIAFGCLGQYVPSYLTDELPFALSGAAYIAIGCALQKL